MIGYIDLEQVLEKHFRDFYKTQGNNTLEFHEARQSPQWKVILQAMKEVAEKTTELYEEVENTYEQKPYLYKTTGEEIIKTLIKPDFI